MNTVVARVLRVLTGHSPTAMIHAVDEHGHEHKLEVPVESTRDVATGRILVLQWSVHGLPGVVQDSSGIEIVPVVEAVPAASPPTTVSGVIESKPESTDDAAQLEALLGLRPGRLRGTGPADLP